MIDPQLSLDVKTPQFASPLDQLGKAASIADTVAQIQQRQAQAAAEAEQAPLRRMQIAAQTKQVAEANALKGAFDGAVAYDPDSKDITYDDDKAAQILHQQNMDYLMPQYQSQKDQQRTAHRTQALGELDQTNQVIARVAVPAENFLALDGPGKAKAYPALRATLIQVNPASAKILPYEYDPEVVDPKLQQTVDQHEQTKDVAEKLTDAQKKEALQAIADKTMSVEDLWKKKGGEGAPTPQFRNAVVAQRAGVQAPPPASYIDKPLLTEKIPGNKLPVDALGADGEPIAGEDRLPDNAFKAMKRGDGSTYYLPVFGAKPNVQQVKDAKVQAAYAFSLGKNVADLNAMEKAQADTWYKALTPEKQTDFERRLALYEKDPNTYQALFGHGTAGSVTPAIKATILGRINAAIAKQGLDGKDAADYKAERLQELKDAGIDMSASSTKSAPASSGTKYGPTIPRTLKDGTKGNFRQNLSTGMWERVP